MNFNNFRSTLPALFFTVLLVVLSACTQSRYARFGGYAQGGTWGVKANLAGVKVKPAEIQKHIESILYEIDTTLSGYNKASQLSRFNNGEEVALSEMFNEVLDAAYGFWKETDGALDCAAGPLFDIWGFGFKTDSLPSDELVRRTLASCGMKLLDSSELSRPVLLRSLDPLPEGPLPLAGGGRYSGNGQDKADKYKADCAIQLNFNAIAQGYSCDKVAEYLYGIGVKDMLVDIGEIYCDGLNPQGKPWRVGVDRPKDGNNSPGADLDGIWESDGGPQGIVTSGNYRKYYIKDGVKYSHTIDPRAGWPVQHNLLSATIIAPTAMEADAYATYCMVIGLEAAKEFIESRPDIEGYLICSASSPSATDNGMVEWASAGFNLIK